MQRTTVSTKQTVYPNWPAKVYTTEIRGCGPLPQFKVFFRVFHNDLSDCAAGRVFQNSDGSWSASRKCGITSKKAFETKYDAVDHLVRYEYAQALKFQRTNSAMLANMTKSWGQPAETFVYPEAKDLKPPTRNTVTRIFSPGHAELKNPITRKDANGQEFVGAVSIG